MPEALMQRLNIRSTGVALALSLAPMLPALAGPAPYLPVPDTTAAAAQTARFFVRYFDAKSAHDLDRTMSFFAPDLVAYIDATLGWDVAGFGALRGVFASYMPTWPSSAISYPTRILGGSGSALVAFTDTPELFGAELRILGAVDFKDGKIVRWVDYWDSRGLDPALDARLRTPENAFPTDFREQQTGEHAAPLMQVVARRLHAALTSSDTVQGVELFTNDAVFEDLSTRIRIAGRAAIMTYLGRVRALLAFGPGASLRHVVGNGQGGGYEWRGAPGSGVRAGITALELDREGHIRRLTTVYDGFEIDADRLRLLQQAALP